MDTITNQKTTKKTKASNQSQGLVIHAKLKPSKKLPEQFLTRTKQKKHPTIPDLSPETSTLPNTPSKTTLQNTTTNINQTLSNQNKSITSNRNLAKKSQIPHSKATKNGLIPTVNVEISKTTNKSLRNHQSKKFKLNTVATANQHSKTLNRF